MALNTVVFGGGLGPIWLSNVQCVGFENRLTDCVSTAGAEDYRCVHSEDAGVRCPDDSGMYIIIVVIDCIYGAMFYF